MLRLGPFLGMAGKQHAAYLKPEYLQYALDVDFSRGTLAPMRTDRLVSAEAKGNTIWLESCCLKWFPTCTNITRDTLGCERIFATGVPGYDYPVHARPADWCAGNLCRLGWPCFDTPPDVEYGTMPVTIRKGEKRTYVYTYVNAYGEESPPSPPSDLALVDYDQPATISGFQEPGQEFCAQRLRIYALIAGVENGNQQTGADNDEFYLIADLPADTLIHTHSPLNEVPGEMLMTDRFAGVPADARDVSHWGTNQLVFLSGNLVKFTEPWNYSVAPPKYDYEPKFNPVRLVATQQYAYVLTCASPEVIDLKKDCEQGGCHAGAVLDDRYPIIGRQSPATHNESVVYASTEGLVLLSGPRAALLTAEIFNQAQWDALQPQTMRGVVHNGYYYGTTDTATFRVELPGSGRSGMAEKMSYLSIKPTAWYVTSDNRLLYADETGTHEVGQGDSFKRYKAISKLQVNPRDEMMGAIRLHSGCGDVKITQKVAGQVCTHFSYSLTIDGSTAYRLPRIRTGEFEYEFEGTSEITTVIFARSFREISEQGA